MRGDGTMEMTPVVGSSKAPVPSSEDSVSAFSVQTFPEIEAVSWDRSSALTKLLTIAAVCNKAKFVFSDTDARTHSPCYRFACSGDNSSSLPQHHLHTPTTWER